ncbi:unnamed protein product [Paramecium octaurelia]|uniref:Uncharacterized protein n=1 Tax=Paramecium octaurelia TaxID=43137 RepID=A0A8S1VZ32_PAROT|nr:unnamed protein product [Paramecium octaurelia]
MNERKCGDKGIRCVISSNKSVEFHKILGVSQAFLSLIIVFPTKLGGLFSLGYDVHLDVQMDHQVCGFRCLLQKEGRTL